MTSQMQSAIKAHGLTKVYQLPRGGRKAAVDSLDLDVRDGEIFGFLGRNGAGKTTTIKMLLGFIRPTSGSAEILGVPVDRPTARAPVGYLPEQPYFHKFMNPWEIISMHAALIGIPKRERRGATEQAVEVVGIQELARTPVAKLSKGQVQRVGIAQALVGNPRVLILDEPASGLDPLGRLQVRDLLISQRKQGRTVFLSSHLLSEIETVCDRVAILANGKLVASGAPEEIKQGDIQTSVVTRWLSAQLVTRVLEIGGRPQYSEGDTIITIDPANLYELIDLLREADLPLISVMPNRESLEDAFLRLAA